MAKIPILRTSERRTYKRCIWRWYQSYRMGLVPLGHFSDALWFGTGVHLGLAEWYSGPGLKRGRYPSEVFAEWAEGELRFIKTRDRKVDGIDVIITERLEPAMKLGVAMLEGYIRLYGQDDSIFMLEPEHPFQINIADPDEIEKVLAIYAGTYDGVYRNLDQSDRPELFEHKTAATISLDHLPIDDQAGSYWSIASRELRQSGLIGPKESIGGINYNFLRKALPDERPKNAVGLATNKPIKQHYVEALVAFLDGVTESDGKPWEKHSLAYLENSAKYAGITVLGDVSKQQPAPLFVREFVTRTPRERATQIQRIQDEALHMDAVRSGGLPLTKNPSYNCRWDCEFFDLCALNERGAPGEREYRDAMYTQRDPYADHRKSTEEG